MKTRTIAPLFAAFLFAACAAPPPDAPAPTLADTSPGVTLRGNTLAPAPLHAPAPLPPAARGGAGEDCTFNQVSEVQIWYCCFGADCPLNDCAQPTGLPPGATAPGACCETTNPNAVRGRCVQYYQDGPSGAVWYNDGAGWMCRFNCR